MRGILKKTALAFTLAASALGAVTPVQANYRHHYRGGNDAAVAIGAGVVGLAIGAAIASDNNRYYDGYDDRRYRGRYYSDRRYYRDRHYDDRRYYRERPYGYSDRYYNDRPRYRYRQRCVTDRVYDEWQDRWVRIRRCN